MFMSFQTCLAPRPTPPARPAAVSVAGRAPVVRRDRPEEPASDFHSECGLEHIGVLQQCGGNSDRVGVEGVLVDLKL